MRYKLGDVLPKGKKDIVNAIGLIAFIACNLLYDYTNLSSDAWFIGNYIAMACFVYSSTLSAPAGIYTKFALWLVISSLIEEFAFIFGFGNVLKPNFIEYVSIELFFVYEFLKFKGWLRF